MRSRPEPDDAEAWARLDGAPPTVVVVLKPDHVRDVDLFVRRYGARAFGPWLFYPGEAPRCELEPVEPGTEIPGGSWPCTTVAVGLRRRSGSPSTARWCSPTPWPRPRASCSSGTARPSRSARYPPCAPCSSCRSSG